jgi:L,D-peptidoglycan transpeptidase YkuD (ErfK/YbiS/YcfS/YnhG family)
VSSSRIRRRRLARIEVAPLPRLAGARAQGRLRAGGAMFPCALGPAGVTSRKREGDGATPRGEHPLRRLWRRADRGPRPPTGLAVRIVRRDDGWCDAPGARLYNRPVRLPFSASHEAMWRVDGLYDLVVELGWNDRPATPGRGSAIFLHAARPDFSATAGCVALAPAALRRLVAKLGPETRLSIAMGPRKIRPAVRARTASRGG